MAGYNLIEIVKSERDIHQVIIPAPFGDLAVYGNKDTFLYIAFPNDSSLREFDFPKAVDLVDFPLLKCAVTKLEKYFSGEVCSWKDEFIPQYTPFMSKVWKLAAEIPFGSIVTYGELASFAGSPKAARAVGMAMARNPIPVLIPCHRVVGADGSLTGFGGGLDVKRWLLEYEGIQIT